MAESIFPFFNDFTIAETTLNFPLYKEAAWDFDNNVPVFENTKLKIVTGNEAITTWCWKTLHTDRFRYLIYSWNYGQQIEQIIGKQYKVRVTKAEISRAIQEALDINPYITYVTVDKMEFEGSKLSVSCTVRTIYGESNITI